MKAPGPAASPKLQKMLNTAGPRTPGKPDPMQVALHTGPSGLPDACGQSVAQKGKEFETIEYLER